MAKFYINGGKKGAGWIGGVRFPSPTEYETDDLAMIDALRKAGSVVSELSDEDVPVDAIEGDAPVTFADMSMPELRAACDMRDLPYKRSKAEMIEQLEIDIE